MKLTKRFLAVLLAVLLVAAMLAVPSMTAGAEEDETFTYTAVSAGITTLNLTETLTVTYPGTSNPAVTYTLTLGTPDAYEDDSSDYPPSEDTMDDLGNLSGEVLGTVTFAAGAASYGPPENRAYALNTETIAAINAVPFDRPCIVFLPIIKSIDCDDPQVSNNNEEDTALVIVVSDEDGTLVPTVSVVNLVNDMPSTSKVNGFDDEYPAVQSLSLTKQVTGNMGQKDRYFRFIVRLTWDEAADDAVGETLTPTGDNSVNTATPKYDEDCEGFNNLAPVTILADGSTPVAEFVFWLKDGETVEIPNLPYGADWEIWENDEYRGNYSTTSVATDGGDAPITGNEYINSDSMPIVGDQADVVFTNDLTTSPPTGLTLQAAAPIAGAVIALGLGAVLLLGRRRRNNRSDA